MVRKRTRGRPKTISKHLIDLLCDNIKLGVTLDTAARGAGISPATMYRWKRDAISMMENDQEYVQHFTPEYLELLRYFVDKTAEANAEAELELAKIMKQHAVNDWRPAWKMLEARFGWGKREIVVTGGSVLNDAKREQLDVRKMSLAELEELAGGITHNDDIVEGSIVDGEEQEEY